MTGPTLPVFLDSVDIAEILGASKSTALKFIKAAGGIQVGSRWKISAVKFDRFVSSGDHVDLSRTCPPFESITQTSLPFRACQQVLGATYCT